MTSIAEKAARTAKLRAKLQDVTKGIVDRTLSQRVHFADFLLREGLRAHREACGVRPDELCPCEWCQAVAQFWLPRDERRCGLCGRPLPHKRDDKQGRPIYGLCICVDVSSLDELGEAPSSTSSTAEPRLPPAWRELGWGVEPGKEGGNP